MARKFKSGDWVKLKGKSFAPKMEVLKYVPKKDSITGLVNSDNYLECIWYKNGERNSVLLHQNRLIKLIETGGIYKA
ncbi:hypothetical protein [Hanstruepera flava]|uniref:hypothetical protein n=1 Tax=Hanstruepera flava TaxID=2930218 RepID=UPI0020281E35|nr:hypothetical protein [Hanstruepera flava]